jgi:general secretion pathway protein G
LRDKPAVIISILYLVFSIKYLKNMESNINRYRNKHLNSGFTLIEILVASAIVALLSVTGVTGFQAITRNGRDAVRKTDLEQIRSALEIYKSENNFYPTTTVTCVPAIPTNYINKYPNDPKPTPYKYCYVQVNDLSYKLCAHLENTSNPTIAAFPTNSCGGSCNYQVVNP